MLLIYIYVLLSFHNAINCTAWRQRCKSGNKLLKVVVRQGTKWESYINCKFNALPFGNHAAVLVCKLCSTCLQQRDTEPSYAHTTDILPLQINTYNFSNLSDRHTAKQQLCIKDMQSITSPQKLQKYL